MAQTYGTRRNGGNGGSEGEGVDGQTVAAGGGSVRRGNVGIYRMAAPLRQRVADPRRRNGRRVDCGSDFDDSALPRAMGIVDCGQYPDNFAVDSGMVEKRRNEPTAFADVRHVFVQFGLRLYQLDEAGKTVLRTISIKLQRSSENPVSGFRRPFAYSYYSGLNLIHYKYLDRHHACLNHSLRSKKKFS